MRIMVVKYSQLRHIAMLEEEGNAGRAKPT